MDIAVAGRLAKAADHVTEKLSEADVALDAYIVALGELWAAGGIASDISGTPSCLLSPKAQTQVAAAISLVAQVQYVHTEIHRALHEDKKRLAPTEERSGPGDKTPPPKP